MDGIENVIIDILVAGSYKHSALELKLVLLPALLLDYLLALLVLGLILPTGSVIPIDVFNALPVLVVLGTGQLGISVLILVLLIVIKTLDFILVLLFIRDVKKLEESAVELLLIIFNDLHKHGIADYPDALPLEDSLDLGCNVLVLECLRVNERQVSHHVLLLLLIVLGTQVAGLLGDYESDLLSTHASCEQALDASVCTKRPAVDHAILWATSIGQSIHQGAAKSQVIVKFGIIDGKHSLNVTLV